jgi:aryl-alcohol dehydrogenase-like predicted oxidoreductase
MMTAGAAPGALSGPKCVSSIGRVSVEGRTFEPYPFLRLFHSLGDIMMERRKLGALDVSAIGLGCMSMTPIYGVPDADEAVAALHHAADIGMNFIDTSDAYGQNGANEDLVGRALKGRRDKYVLATKFGNIRLPDGKPGAKGDPAYVLEACDKSLKRLGTDYIDLYFIHRVDNTVPIEDTVGAMVKLKEAGKIRHLGISEAGAGTIRRAHKAHKMAAVQTEYSLWSRDVEKEILPACHELGIGFLAYAPLGRGFLTGTVPVGDAMPQNDNRRNMPRFQGDNAKQNLALVDTLKSLAGQEGCTSAQLAIAWLLSRQPQVVPLAGTSKRKWVDENAKAVDVRPSAATLAALDKAFSAGVTHGERYAPAMMARLGL